MIKKYKTIKGIKLAMRKYGKTLIWFNEDYKYFKYICFWSEEKQGYMCVNSKIDIENRYANVQKINGLWVKPDSFYYDKKEIEQCLKLRKL